MYTVSSSPLLVCVSCVVSDELDDDALILALPKSFTSARLKSNDSGDSGTGSTPRDLFDEDDDASDALLVADDANASDCKTCT
jgi:hypothetical protein